MDERTAKVLKKYLPDYYDLKDACWPLKKGGKVVAYIAYHKALEDIAAHNGVTFEQPTLIETDSSKAVSMVVTGRYEDKIEWSIGEASSVNYRTSPNMDRYVWAMAEKRAKDRVILKLIGLHGDVYSESEADEFKNSEPKLDYKLIQKEIIEALSVANNPSDLEGIMLDYKEEIEAMDHFLSDAIDVKYTTRLSQLEKGDSTPDEHRFTVTDALRWLNQEKPKVESMTPQQVKEWYTQNCKMVAALSVLKAEKYKRNDKTPQENFEELIESKMKGEAA